MMNFWNRRSLQNRRSPNRLTLSLNQHEINPQEKSRRRGTSRRDLFRFFSLHKNRSLRVESLEERNLLALIVGSADWNALVAQECLVSTSNPIYVTTLLDVSSYSDGEISLREAIDYAAASSTSGTLGRTIQFRCFGEIDLNGSALEITKDLTIDASTVSGITIDAQNLSRVFSINASSNNGLSTQLSNLVLKNGTPNVNDMSSVGGGIYNGELCSLNLTDVTIRNCTSSNGGGLYNLGMIEMFSSQILANQAGQGAGIYNSSSGNLSIFSSSISENQASTLAGGIFNAGALRMTDVKVSANAAASTHGGGLYNIYAGNLLIESSTISQNTALISGGGIYNAAGNGILSLNQCRFEENAAENGAAIYNTDMSEITIQQTGFSKNSASQSGGAFYNENGSVDLLQSTLTLNTAGFYGGAFYQAANATTIVLSSEFRQNSAGSLGGALENYGTLYATSATFQENSAVNQGGGIHNSGTIQFSQGTIASNTVSARNGQGGGVCNMGTFLLINSLIADNSLSGIQAIGAGISNQATLTVQNSLFLDNHLDGSSSRGGGLYNNNTGNVTLTKTVFSGNSATDEGGALYTSGVLTLNWSSVLKNVDVSAVGVYVDTSYSQSHFTNNNSLIEDNASALPVTTDVLTLTSSAALTNNLLSLSVRSSATQSAWTQTFELTNCDAETIQIAASSLQGNASDSFQVALYDEQGQELPSSFLLEPGQTISGVLRLRDGASIPSPQACSIRLALTVLESTGESFGNAKSFLIDTGLVIANNQATLAQSEPICVTLDEVAGEYSVVLQSKPIESVFVYVIPDSGLKVSKTVLTFDASNWNLPQTVVVTADSQTLRNISPPDVLRISHDLVTSDSIYRQTVVDQIAVEVSPYISVQSGGMTRLSEQFSDTAFWDLNNDDSYQKVDWVAASELGEGQPGSLDSVQKKEAGGIENVFVSNQYVSPVIMAKKIETKNNNFIQLQLEAVPQSDSSLASWQISWGDGSTQTIESCDTFLNVGHLYFEEGTYQISVEVVDSLGNGQGQFYFVGTHNVAASALTQSVAASVNIVSANVASTDTVESALETSILETSQNIEAFSFESALIVQTGLVASGAVAAESVVPSVPLIVLSERATLQSVFGIEQTVGPFVFPRNGLSLSTNPSAANGACPFQDVVFDRWGQKFDNKSDSQGTESTVLPDLNSEDDLFDILALAQTDSTQIDSDPTDLESPLN